MNLDPKHLVQLSVIVEAGSFQGAADRLNLTQPALSRNMRTLEQRLGSDLFKRDGRRSVPNNLGQRLARAGLSIREAEEHASSIALQSAMGKFGELRIGAPPIVAGRFLTDSLSAFIRDNPNCNVILRTGLVHELRSMLARGQIDVMIGPQGIADAENALVFEPLINDPIGILCRAGHALCKHRKVVANDLEAQTWLLHSRGSSLRQQTEAAMVAAGISNIQIAVETDSIRSALEIVSNTDLITTMPRTTTSAYLETSLVFLKFDSTHLYRTIGTIRRRDSLISQLETQFFEQVCSSR